MIRLDGMVPRYPDGCSDMQGGVCVEVRNTSII